MPYHSQRLVYLDSSAAAAALYDRVNLPANSDGAGSRHTCIIANGDADGVGPAHDLGSIAGHPGVIALYKIVAICRRRYAYQKRSASSPRLDPGRSVIKIANRRVLHRLKYI